MMLSSVLPISIAGFVLASYFSAVMSTADSCLIAASGNVKTKSWWTNWLLEGIKENETTQKIAYALIWRNEDKNHFHGPYPGHEGVLDFIEFYNDPDVLFNTDLPNLYRD